MELKCRDFWNPGWAPERWRTTWPQYLHLHARSIIWQTEHINHLDLSRDAKCHLGPRARGSPVHIVERGREPWLLHDVGRCGSSPHDLVARSNLLLVKLIFYFILMLLIWILLAFEAFVRISVFWFYGAISIRRSYLILCLHIFK